MMVNLSLFIAPIAASDGLYPILSLYEQTNFTIPSTEINTVKSFLLLLKVFLPLIVPQWCHLPLKNISETFKTDVVGATYLHYSYNMVIKTISDYLHFLQKLILKFVGPFVFLSGWS